MPFQTAPRRCQCNDCRKPIERGDRCYLGERTGMAWCPDCATTTLHVAPDTAPASQPSVRFPDGWGRFSPRPIASWHDRSED